MSTIGASLAALAALGVIMAIVLYAVLAAGWRIVHDDGQVRMFQVLRRHGATPDQALGMAGYQAALAMRRCAMCADKAACDVWLASGAKRGVEAFCPNADFIGRIVRLS